MAASLYVVLASYYSNARYPKLGLRFRGGRCQILRQDLEKLQKKAGNLWGREFGILGEFTNLPRSGGVVVVRTSSSSPENPRNLVQTPGPADKELEEPGGPVLP